MERGGRERTAEKEIQKQKLLEAKPWLKVCDSDALRKASLECQVKHYNGDKSQCDDAIEAVKACLKLQFAGERKERDRIFWQGLGFPKNPFERTEKAS